MKHLKFYQSIYLLAALCATVAGNTWLALNIQNRMQTITQHQEESTKRYQLIAQQSERIDFYNSLDRKIQDELRIYRGRDIVQENPTVEPQKLTREQRRAKAREDFLRRQKNRDKAASTGAKTITSLQLNSPLPLSTPSYLHKISATPKDYTHGKYNTDLKADTEYFRFLEWYSYFFTKYPFSMPQEIHMKVTDKKAYRNIPTEISISGKVEILVK